MAPSAPLIVGGATVIAYSSIDSRHRPTGGCRQIVAGVLQRPAAGLAICQYKSEDAYYLFGCDENWQSKTDTWHETLEDAMNQAEFEYAGVRKTWLNHQPAWEPMTEADENTVWDLFFERFKFKPSFAERPGFHEPEISVTHDVSHVFGEGGLASKTSVADLNMEMLNLFRQCVLPGDRLYALDWQHQCYWFNPYGLFELSDTYKGMIPVLPDGDYSIFLADDFRFGAFGHPWELTICLWGNVLLDLAARQQPKLLGRIVRKDRHAVG